MVMDGGDYYYRRRWAFPSSGGVDALAGVPITRGEAWFGYTWARVEWEWKLRWEDDRI